jgi:hypothetical protein
MVAKERQLLFSHVGSGRQCSKTFKVLMENCLNFKFYTQVNPSFKCESKIKTLSEMCRVTQDPPWKNTQTTVCSGRMTGESRMEGMSDRKFGDKTQQKLK